MTDEQQPHESTDHELAELLRDAAESFRPSDDARERVRATLERELSVSAPTTRRLRLFQRPMVRSGIAASFAALVFAIAFFGPSSSLTLAEMRSAIAAEEWVRIAYSDGETQWLSPARGLQARDDGDGFRVFIDYGVGARWTHFAGSSSIAKDSVEPFDMGASAWDAIVGPLQRRSDEGDDKRWQVERHEEEVEGRALVRFDSWFVDAVDERQLSAQLWADPETRLPLRLRQRRSPGQRDRGDDGDVPEWAEATYTFPDEGPLSIYDLGVPQGLAIAEASAAPVAAAVDQVLDAALERRRSFPATFRVVSWGEDESEIDILYWDGRPSLAEYESGGLRSVYTPVRMRSSRYFDLGPEFNEYHPEDRSSAEALLEWASSQTPVSTDLWDGERAFTQRGPMPDVFQEPDLPSLRVTRSPAGDLYFANQHWPLELFWPRVLRRRSADIERIPEGDSASGPEGTVGLRWTEGASRHELWFDPSRDYLCVSYTRLDRGKGEWARVSERRLEDLRQLENGRWIATTVRNVSSNGAPRVRHYDLAPMTSDELPPSVFDGTALVEAARARGDEIEGW